MSRTTRKGLFAILVLTALMQFGLGASFAQKPQLTPEERAFILREESTARMMARLGQLAEKRAQNEQVRKSAINATSVQTNMHALLKRIGEQKGVPIPFEMAEKDTGVVQRISGVSGRQFDHEYVRLMLGQYTTTIQNFKTEADTGRDPDLRAFASKNLPQLQQELAVLEGIQLN